MASITSTATGNWASGGTWVGGVAPGDGDTAIIANGHTVTIANGTTVTVGNSAAPATPAIQTAVATAGTGILIVGTNAVLNLKAMVIQGNANWVINAGATINFVHATTALEWRIGDAATNTNSILTMNGALGSRITVTSTLAAFGKFTGVSNNNCGKLQATFVSFSNLGAAAVGWWKCDNFSGTSFVGFLDDCTVTSCGKIDFTNNFLPAGATFRLRRCTFKTPLHANDLYIDLLTATGVHTGVVFQNLCVEGSVHLSGQSATASGFQWSNVVIKCLDTTLPPWDCTTSPPAGTFDLTFLYNTANVSGTPSILPNGTITNICSLRNRFGNPHALSIAVRPGAPTVIDTGCWEFEQDDETGDELLILNNPATPESLLVQHIICPHSPDGLSAAGSFVNVAHAGISTNNRITVRHNTVAPSLIGATPGGAVTTENTSGGTGLFQSIDSNCWYRDTLGAGWCVFQVVGALDNDTFLHADYNCRYNLSGDGYNPLDATFGQPDVPGLHDIVQDPQFVDKSRRFLSWGKALNNSLTTSAQIVDEMFKMNDDSGFDSRFTIAAYIKWMREGFRPLNPSMWNKGRNGTYIGAVPYEHIAPGMPVAVQQRI